MALSVPLIQLRRSLSGARNERPPMKSRLTPAPALAPLAGGLLFLAAYISLCVLTSSITAWAQTASGVGGGRQRPSATIGQRSLERGRIGIQRPVNPVDGGVLGDPRTGHLRTRPDTGAVAAQPGRRPPAEAPVNPTDGGGLGGGGPGSLYTSPESSAISRTRRAGSPGLIRNSR